MNKAQTIRTMISSSPDSDIPSNSDTQKHTASDSTQEKSDKPHPEAVDEPSTTNDNKNQSWIDDFEPLPIDEYLDSDPVDSHGDSSFVGVWHAARGLMEFFHQSTWDNAQYVLELGAGTGWLGITICRNKNSIQNMVLSDTSRTGAVQWTEKNVKAAQARGFPCSEHIRVVALDWDDPEQAEDVASMYPWDLIVGSDLIYSEDRIRPLAQTISILLSQHQSVRCIYGHTEGRIQEMDRLWEQAMKDEGLIREVLATLLQWDRRRNTVVMQITRRPRGEC